MFTWSHRALPTSAVVNLHVTPVNSCFLTALLMLNSSDCWRPCNTLNRAVKASKIKCLCWNKSWVQTANMQVMVESMKPWVIMASIHLTCLFKDRPMQDVWSGPNSSSRSLRVPLWAYSLRYMNGQRNLVYNHFLPCQWAERPHKRFDEHQHWWKGASRLLN